MYIAGKNASEVFNNGIVVGRLLLPGNHLEIVNVDDFKLAEEEKDIPGFHATATVGKMLEYLSTQAINHHQMKAKIYISITQRLGE